MERRPRTCAETSQDFHIQFAKVRPNPVKDSGEATPRNQVAAAVSKLRARFRNDAVYWEGTGFPRVRPQKIIKFV
jgi:hypothetical protein